MDPGPLDMFHNTGDEDIRAVAYAVHFHFLADQVFINQNRMLLDIPVNDCHKLNDITVIYRNLHPLPAEDIGWTHKYRIPQFIGRLQRLFRCKYSCSRRARNLALLKDFIKPLSILGRIHIIGTCSKNRNAHLHNSLCQFNGRLAAELNNRPIRIFQADDILHILRGQRFKIKFIGNIKIRTYGFRIVVDNNGFIARFRQCPYAVYGAVIKLYPLSDSDWAGAENNHLLTHGIPRFHFVQASKTGIIVWGFRFKFGCTGIYHFKCGDNTAAVAQRLYLCFTHAGKLGNRLIREFHPLRFFKKFHRQFFRL